MVSQRMLEIAKQSIDSLTLQLPDLERDLKSGQAIFVVTCHDGGPLDETATKKRYPSTSRQRAKREHRLDDMARYLFEVAKRAEAQGLQYVPKAEFPQIVAEVTKLVPTAFCTRSLEAVIQAIARGGERGDRGHEPMIGKAGIWWFMGNRM